MSELIAKMKNSTTEICGLPMRYYLPMLVILLIAIRVDSLNTDIVGTFAVLMMLGGLMAWIGRKLPVVGSWLGGETLLPLVGGSIIGSLGFLSDGIVENVNSLMSSGLINLIVGAAIAGSILAIDREKAKGILLTSLPSVAIAIACVMVFMLLACWITGTSIMDGIYLTGLPNFCGGSTSCLVAIPSICSSLLGGDPNDWAGRFMITLAMTNTFSVCGAGILGQLNRRRSDGVRNHTKDHQQEKRSDVAVNEVASLCSGFVISLMVLVAGALISQYLPFLNYISWATILALLLKFFDVVDEQTVQGAELWQKYLLGLLVPASLFGCGIVNIDLKSLISYLSGPILLITFLSVLGSVVGAFVAARLFHNDPMEMMIGVGCNTATLGGTGNVAVLSSAGRMDLMPYATITCRIGGALMLILYDITIRFFI